MSRMSDAEDRRAAALAAVPPEHRERAKRIFDAERRVERGIGVRLFHVGYKGRALSIPISDELAVIARDEIRRNVEHIVEHTGDMTESRMCLNGLKFLREVIANDIDNRNLWATARLTLMRLYDDMGLRRFRPWDGEQIFTPIEFTNREPPNEYWLVLHETDDNFHLQFARPSD